MINYGKYLVTMAGCIDCHTKDDKGQLVKGMEYAGGREFIMPFGKNCIGKISPLMRKQELVHGMKIFSLTD